MASQLRQLKIKTGVVNRLSKEVKAYEAEAEGQKRKVDSMEAEGRDFYDIKQQRRVLQETLVMVPDTQRRLGTAATELREIVIAAELEHADSEELKAAQEALELVAV